MKTQYFKQLVAVIALSVVAAGCAKDPVPTIESGAFSDPNLSVNNGNVVAGSVQDFSVNAGDKVHFQTGSSVLTPQAQGTLNRQVAWLNKYPHYQVNVEGHADERGTREYNLALGARRATAVKNYLASRGITANRMRTLSFGKERPVATCNAMSCWQQNRRAVTLLSGG